MVPEKTAFDVAQADYQGESEIEPNRLMSDLGREPISTMAFFHPLANGSPEQP
jgi:hypothetical protein